LVEAIEKKLAASFSDKTVKNILLPRYIAFLDATTTEGREKLFKMATERVFPALPEHKDAINKVQRYACIQRLAAEGDDRVEGLIEAEAQIEYSA
jgi:hypothetical protein